MHLVVGSRELIDPTDIEANEAEFVMVKSDFGILLSSPEQHRNKTLEKLIFGLQVRSFPTHFQPVSCTATDPTDPTYFCHLASDRSDRSDPQH